MKLLIITQKVNREDSVLGFFHSWIREFATHFEKVTVICLEKGTYDLPQNVAVLSLGKEGQRSKVKGLSPGWNIVSVSCAIFWEKERSTMSSSYT